MVWMQAPDKSRGGLVFAAAKQFRALLALASLQGSVEALAPEPSRHTDLNQSCIALLSL